MNKILIVDDEEDIRDILEIIIDSEFDNEIVKAASGNEAIEILKKDSEFSAIVSDYTMKNGTGGDLYQYVKESSKIPFTLLTGGYLEDYLDMSDFYKTNELNLYLNKPIDENVLIKHLSNIVSNSSDQDAKSQEKNEHIKLNIEYLKKHIEHSYDIFLKLPSKKLIQIFKKGDEIDINRLESYKAKGERFVYLLKEDFDSFYQKATENLFKRITESTDSKMAFDAAGETIQYTGEALNEIGISQTQFKLVNAAADACIQNLKSSKTVEKKLEAFLKNKGYLISHSITTLHISHMIIKEMNYSSNSILEKMAFASFLHDITLSHDYLSEVKYAGSEKFLKLNSEEHDQILKHPEKAKKIIQNMKEIPSDVDTIIGDHHERSEGKGFPKGLSATQLNPLSCIFILSLEVADFFYFYKINSDSLAILQNFLKKNFSNGNYEAPLKILLEKILILK